MPKIRAANPGQLRVRIKWYVSRQSNFWALILTNSNCPDRTRMWRRLLLISDHALMPFFRQGYTRGDAGAAKPLSCFFREDFRFVLPMNTRRITVHGRDGLRGVRLII